MKFIPTPTLLLCLLPIPLRRHFNPLFFSAVFLPPPPSAFHSRKSSSFHCHLPVLSHSSLASHPLLPIPQLCQRKSSMKMFWPSIIAASRMFSISLTPEPRSCSTDGGEMCLDTQTHLCCMHTPSHPQTWSIYANAWGARIYKTQTGTHIFS